MCKHDTSKATARYSYSHARLKRHGSYAQARRGRIAGKTQATNKTHELDMENRTRAAHEDITSETKAELFVNDNGILIRSTSNSVKSCKLALT